MSRKLNLEEGEGILGFGEDTEEKKKKSEWKRLSRVCFSKKKNTKESGDGDGDGVCVRT